MTPVEQVMQALTEVERELDEAAADDMFLARYGADHKTLLAISTTLHTIVRKLARIAVQ